MMNKWIQKYSIIIVVLFITLYNIFADIKTDLEYPYFTPFHGGYMLLLLIPIVITFILEDRYKDHILKLRYTRFIISMLMIFLIIITMLGLYENFGGLFSGVNLFVDILLGVILIIFVILSNSLENTYYENKDIDISSYLSELTVNSLLFMSLTTVLVIELILVLFLGALGLRI